MNCKLKSLAALVSLGLVTGSFVSSASADDAANSDSARARLEERSGTSSLEKQRLVKRLINAKDVFRQLLTAPDGGLPEDLLRKSNCVAVLPDVLKAAFVVGGEFGRGVLSCKTSDSGWSAPAFVELRAASFGWQIGGKSTDLVLFFVGEKAKHVLTTSKLTLGADIGVTAGPVGRRAEGSLGTNLEGVYSYAHSEGIFAGLALNGADLLPDESANREYYSSRNDVTTFVLNNMPTSSLPEEAKSFINVLPK